MFLKGTLSRDTNGVKTENVPLVHSQASYRWSTIILMQQKRFLLLLLLQICAPHRTAMLICSLPIKSRIFAKLPALFMALLMQSAEHKMAALTFRVFSTLESGFKKQQQNLMTNRLKSCRSFLIKQNFHSYRNAFASVLP